MTSPVDKQRAYYKRGLTLGYEARLSALCRMDECLRQFEDKIVQALYDDFQKSAFESFTTEFSMLYDEIYRSKRQLKKWMKPETVKTNWINWPAKSAILREPLGVNFIIGAWKSAASG